MALQYINAPGLQETLNAAGFAVVLHDGVFASNDDAQAQPIIDAYTVAQAIAFRQAESSAYAKSLRDKVIDVYSYGETSSWPIKRAEAMTFATSNNPSDAPMLSIEAAARGCTLADLVAKVQANNTAFSQLEATIAGVDGKHRDALAALTTFADVAAYDLTTGWPAV
jgi:hypothetical protein